MKYQTNNPRELAVRTLMRTSNGPIQIFKLIRLSSQPQ